MGKDTEHFDEHGYDAELAYPVVVGGGGHVASKAHLGPIHRKGSQLFQTFVFKRPNKQQGDLRAGQVCAQRIDYTPSDIEAMIIGTAKAPSGVGEKMLIKAFTRLTERQEQLAANQQRFNQMARRARQNGKQGTNVRIAPAAYHKRMRCFVQTFWFPDSLPAPEGSKQTPAGAKLTCTATDLSRYLKKPETIPEGLTPQIIKGRLTILERQKVHKSRGAHIR